MRTEFAATSAQVIPVLAFVLVALVVPLRRAVKETSEVGTLAFLGAAALIYGALAVCLVDAEFRCLATLRDPAASDATDASFVVRTIRVTMVLLLLGPFIVVITEIFGSALTGSEQGETEPDGSTSATD
ncbi:hypothetical protein [Nocardia fluminea]|uniref:hypothetical protein n=1 Tax=Nocardia fluminea TaxID=134984 RepID=UPI00379EE985